MSAGAAVWHWCRVREEVRRVGVYSCSSGECRPTRAKLRRVQHIPLGHSLNEVDSLAILGLARPGCTGEGAVRRPVSQASNHSS